VGGDAAEGETLLTAGTRMRPMQIAVAASAGRKAVTVRPRPRVVVLSTGDELTEPGTPLVPGRIWDSNSYMIAAAAREAGAVARRRPGVPDDPKGVLPALEEQLAHADLLITTGGVSMGGEHDVVKAALRKLGTVTFRKVAMQPGMPQGFGVLGKGGEGGLGGAGGVGAKRGVPIFTLPGNPVSAYVSFQMFVRPALAALQGASDLSLPSVRATLTGPVRSPSRCSLRPCAVLTFAPFSTAAMSLPFPARFLTRSPTWAGPTPSSSSLSGKPGFPPTTR